MTVRTRSAHSELWRGLIQLHVLHHATEEDVYGLGLIQELRRHGYSIGPGTLYPLLHRLTERGYLRERAVERGRQRRYYATAKGRRALAEAYHYVKELSDELHRPAIV
jgi:DNA-binding PadR family transcriptional regulator